MRVFVPFLYGKVCSSDHQNYDEYFVYFIQTNFHNLKGLQICLLEGKKRGGVGGFEESKVTKGLFLDLENINRYTILYVLKCIRIPGRQPDVSTHHGTRKRLATTI